MEHPSLRHRGFNHLPDDIQLKILNRIDSSWLFIRRVRSFLPKLKKFLPDPPSYQDMVIPFFNNNGEVLSDAILRTYDVFNFRDDGWIVQVKYNPQEEGVQKSVRLMHQLTNLHFESEFVPPRYFDSVDYDSIELRSSYRLTASVNNEVFRKIAFRPKSVWTDSEDFMLLMIWHDDRLALYKATDKTWGLIQHLCVDVICFERDFYALESTGRTFMVHADRTTEEVVSPVVGVNGHNKRLVESGGSLLLVDQFYCNPNVQDVNDRRTSRFVVFRFVEEEHVWMRIHTLGEHVLFVGYFNCFSAAAVDVAGARGDLIYFSEAFAVDVKDEDEDEDEDDENENEKEIIQGPGNEDGNEDEDDENENEKEIIQGPGNEDGNVDEEGEALHRASREDVAFFDMVDGSITELRSPGAATFAACFWPPPAWTANAAV